jgi:phospholipase/carboxylesterase
MATNQSNLLEDCSLDAKIKVYYDLHLPETLPAPLLIALHGYGANKRHMLREAREIAPESFVIASLQGFHQHIREPREEGEPLRFGFGWLTNFRPDESVGLHHKALLDLINQLIKEKVADPQNLFLLGFSQSCALNYRFAFSHPAHLKGVIGICGGLPGDWENSELYQPTKAAVLHLAGARDEFYPPSRVESYAERLRMRAVNVEFYTHDAGHEIVSSMREDIHAWLKGQTQGQTQKVAEKSKSQIWG